MVRSWPNWLLGLVGPVVAGLALAGPATRSSAIAAPAVPAASTGASPGSAASAAPVAAGSDIVVKPSEVAPGHPPGEVRRVIQPFGSWTLICDENVKAKRRICNVSQSFVDGTGAPAFSWTLAATRGGAPVLILRMPREGEAARRLRISFAGGGKPSEVRLDSCDAALCVGFLPVGRELKDTLRRSASAEIALELKGRPERIEAPLKDLTAALAALK